MQFLDDPMLKPLMDDDYVAFGLACCFVMNDDLKLDSKFYYFFYDISFMVGVVCNIQSA